MEYRPQVLDGSSASLQPTFLLGVGSNALPTLVLAVHVLLLSLPLQVLSFTSLPTQSSSKLSPHQLCEGLLLQGVSPSPGFKPPCSALHSNCLKCPHSLASHSPSARLERLATPQRQRREEGRVLGTATPLFLWYSPYLQVLTLSRGPDPSPQAAPHSTLRAAQ